jgi:hypothetical protein
LKTPKLYTDNLKNRIITKAMLEACLYSVNKRAKNCRDMESGYRHCRDYYNNEKRYRNRKNEYYDQKDILLTLAVPDCIHTEPKIKKTRTYDYDSDYSENQVIYQVVYEGDYYDHELHRVVHFVDVKIPTTAYYLFYDFGTHSYHTPIEESEVENYPNLQIKDIGKLVTHGEDISEPVSTQFVAKVIKLIDTHNYQYIITESIYKGDN